jgi:type I restriction enzyme S subunit
MELKPGYKQTVVGVIPEDWEVRSLQDLCKEEITYGIVQCGPHVPSGIPYIRVSDMDGPILDTEKMLCTSSQIASRFRRSEVRHGDIVYALRGRLGDVRSVPLDLDGANLTQGTARISPGLSVHSPFLLWALRNPEVVLRACAESKGTTFMEITLSDLRQIKIAVPPEPEQVRIASTLSDIEDHFMSLHLELAKKRNLKQATMQELLTGKRRLPGFDGEWEVKRLGEISTISMGRTPSRTNQEYWGRGHTWLSIADLKSKIVTDSKEEITDSAASSMSVIPKGTLLMSFKLSIGKLSFAGRDLFTNEAICSFNALDASSEFLYYVLGRTDFSLYGKQAVKGYTLNMESLQTVEVCLPPREEQDAIASVLSSIDEEILILDERREKALSIKQGMMQQLLTGKIRLT